MSEEIFVFSYDNDEDVLNTLAKYHQTTNENIFAKWETLKQLYAEYHESQNQALFLMAIYGCLSTQPLNLKGSTFKIFFYHRTGSNGTKAWFSKGLLNSRDGISSFVSNIDSLYPELNFKEYEGALLGKDSQKHMSKVVGPFAFFRKKDAIENSYQRSFLNLPEVLFDVAKGEQIYDFLLRELKPTVVKFWVEKPLEYLDYYIVAYWELLLGCSERGTDVGRGKSISSKNILEVITLQKYQTTD